MVSLIVAQSNNRVIGKSNDLPWYLPADLRHFREITTGHPVIMGRKTYESIHARLGKPLPDRENIVVTHDEMFVARGCVVVHSLTEALSFHPDKEVFVIGGSSLYDQALPRAQRIYLTQVKASIDGDKFFPELSPQIWQTVGRQAYTADEKNPYDYEFLVLERK
jgi:dihydrofolate reductase